MTELNLSTIQKMVGEVLNDSAFDSSLIQPMTLLTTNAVFRYGNFVFKKLTHQQSFEAEITVYQNKKIYSFNLPEFIGYYVDDINGYWIILRYMPSRNVAELFEDESFNTKAFAKEFSEIIAEFEERSQGLPHLGVLKWSITESLTGLYKQLSSVIPGELLDNLKQTVSLADRKLAEFDYRPCFDAFLNNILVTKPGSSIGHEFYYCDFDKAFRSVPMGEQLSHYFMNKHLHRYLDDAVRIYSSKTSMSEFSIYKVLNLTVFGRALSGLRDNFKFLNDAELIVDRGKRYSISKQCISHSLNFLNSFANEVQLSEMSLYDLRRALKIIEKTLEDGFLPNKST